MSTKLLGNVGYQMLRTLHGGTKRYVPPQMSIQVLGTEAGTKTVQVDTRA